MRLQPEDRLLFVINGDSLFLRRVRATNAGEIPIGPIWSSDQS